MWQVAFREDGKRYRSRTGLALLVGMGMDYKSVLMTDDDYNDDDSDDDCSCLDEMAQIGLRRSKCL